MGDPPFGRTDGRTDGRISEPPRRRVYPSMGGRGVLIPPIAPLYIVEWAPFYIIKRAKGGSFPIFYKKRVSASLPEHPFSLLGYPAKGLPPHLWVFIRRRAHRRCHNPPVPFGQRGRDVGDGGERISAFYGGSSASTESMPRSASGEVLCSEVASPWTTSRDPPLRTESIGDGLPSPRRSALQRISDSCYPFPRLPFGHGGRGGLPPGASSAPGGVLR
jgi:hypothetical protein